MPGRGSGIGLGMIGGGVAPIGVGGPGAASQRTGTSRIYGSTNWRGTGAQVHHYLWVLVALELAMLVWLRHAFRRYHGG
jgi:hypothetical protein